MLVMTGAECHSELEGDFGILDQLSDKVIFQLHSTFIIV